MALQLPHSQFFHLTRTGGIWVRRAIISAGIPTNEICQIETKYFYEDKHSYMLKRGTIMHMQPDELNTFGSKRFTIVRHPLNWLTSYFHFKNRLPDVWHPERQVIDRHCATDDFEEFIKLYVKHIPGYYTSIVKIFDRVDFIGRTENLAPDLIRILNKCGEKFDEKSILEQKPVGVTKKTIEIPELSKKLKDKLFKVEDYVIRRYYTDGLI